ncbi:MAG: TonB-dependent receptor [Marinilabiliaceae bacterium]|nr:TonB-dependent receptor [Marinilabiliaceae bacterium]
MLKKSIILLLALLVHIGIIAQQKTISGVVKDNSNDPIPGVSILIKGTTNGTITDIDGKYSLTVPGDNAVLVYSFIGMKSQEITVGTQSTINVSLISDTEEIDEVVVVGYGVQKKKLVTGATAQVKGEELAQRSSTNALQALQGQTAGVNITSTSGQPGESMKVNIRGLGTIGNSGPLYIVDGVQTDGISFLNSSDIESIDVLKDAASAAIYGSRAANGVVLVTTKRGEKGKAQVTLDAYHGIQGRSNKISMLDAHDYAMIMNEQFINSGTKPSDVPFNVTNLPYYTNSGINADMNWLDEMFVDDAKTNNYVLGINGGSEQGVYSLSLSYTDQEGIVGGKDQSYYERYNGRFNSEHKLFENKLRVGNHINFSYINKNGISVGGIYSNSLRGAFSATPLLPMYDNAGEYYNSASTWVDQFGKVFFNNNETNPYALMVINNNNTKEEQRLLGDVYAELDIIQGLTFKTSYGVDYYNYGYRSYTPIYSLNYSGGSSTSSVTQNMSRSFAHNWDNTLTYTKSLGNHKLDAMAGMSMRQSNGYWMNTSNSNAAFDDLDHAYIDNTTNTTVGGGGISIGGAPNDEDKLLSYFGRVQYGFNETYLFNATLRADGSSKFSANNRWGYFPSVSAGWVMSNESFMENASSTISFLKLRASWGQNGNQNISAFQYMAPIKFTQSTYSFGDTEGVVTNGSYPNRLANEDLKWETSEQINVGFDAKLLNNGLNVNFDWYRKSTKDWLVLAPVPATSGTGQPYVNGGSVVNSGVELALSYNNHIGDLNYNITLNGAYNKNEVGNIPTEDGVVHGAANVLYQNAKEFYRAQSGHPIGYFWGLQTDGIFQNQAEITQWKAEGNGVLQSKPAPGDVKFVDQNHDGKINDSDKIDLGDPNPDYTFGLSISLNYKAFDFNVITNGVAGNQIVQSYRTPNDKWANYSQAILNRWHGEGTSNKIPRVTSDNINYTEFSDLFIQEGAYLRISNITLGYDLDKSLNLKFFTKLRLYASVQNLYTFTEYDGMDPEVGFGNDGGEQDKFSSGIDVGYYPRPRTILFGVNVAF